ADRGLAAEQFSAPGRAVLPVLAEFQPGRATPGCVFGKRPIRVSRGPETVGNRRGATSGIPAMGSYDELTAELTRTRRKLSQLTKEVARNTRILQVSQRRELDLLLAADLTALFRQMLDGLRESYGLETVTVVLCDPDHDVRHLLMAAGTAEDDLPGLQCVDSLSGLVPRYVALLQPWL